MGDPPWRDYASGHLSVKVVAKHQKCVGVESTSRGITFMPPATAVWSWNVTAVPQSPTMRKW